LAEPGASAELLGVTRATYDVVIRDLALADADERCARMRMPPGGAARRNGCLLESRVAAVRAVDCHVDRGDFEPKCPSEHARLRLDRDFPGDRRRRGLAEDEAANGAAPEDGRVEIH